MENQNYTFFKFRNDYGIIDHSRNNEYYVFSERDGVWGTISHYSVTVIWEELEEISFNSSLTDLLKNYEALAIKIDERKQLYSAKENKQSDSDE